MLPSKQDLSKLLCSLYDAAADPTMWNPFLEQLALRTRATSAALLIHDFQHAQYSLSSSWQVNPESVRLYQEHYYSLDVWAQRGSAIKPGAICDSETLCPLSEMRTTEIYNDFMLESGIEFGLFGTLENSKSRLASISLYRDVSRSEFTASEEETLRFLSPHLQRAFKLHFNFAKLAIHSEVLETALDALSAGILFLDMKGEVVLMNRSAKSMIDKQDGIFLTSHRLRAERQQETECLLKAIQDACSPATRMDTTIGGAVFISRRKNPPIHVLIGPLRNTSLKVPRSIVAAVFLLDPLQQRRSTDEALRIQFGLSPAECRVALLLGDGHSPREISETIGVSFNTVRTQIKSIFAKTGARRQSELVRLLLSQAPNVGVGN